MSDVAVLLKSLDIARAHVLGHSSGGAIAMVLALERPELAASLTLEEPAALHYEEAIQAIGTAIGRVQSGDVEGGLRDFVDAAAGPGYFDGTSPAMRESFFQNAATVAFAQPPPTVTCELAKKIQVPVLFLEGDRTPVSTRIRDCLEDAKQVVIASASHWSHIDNPEGFNRAVMDFIGRLE